MNTVEAIAMIVMLLIAAERYADIDVEANELHGLLTVDIVSTEDLNIRPGETIKADTGLLTFRPEGFCVGVHSKHPEVYSLVVDPSDGGGGFDKIGIAITNDRCCDCEYDVASRT